MPYTIQETSVDLPTEPIIYQGSTFVSLREITEALGGVVAMDVALNRATATIEPWIAHVTAGNAHCTVDGDGDAIPVEIAAAPYSEGSEMFVPASFFQDAFGYEVRAEDQNVSILNPNAT